MRSVRGLCSKNDFSTPTPCETRRTTTASLELRPLRPITTPSNICVRSFPPSMILEYTFSVAPVPIKKKDDFSCSFSRRPMTLMTLSASYRGAARKFPRALWAAQPPYCNRARKARLLRVPAAGGTPAGLLAPPRRDLGVVAREQHVGYLDAPKTRGARICGVVKLAASTSERFARGRLGVDCSFQQPDRRIQDGKRGNLAAGQHEVPERELLERIERSKPLVDALVVAANQDEPVQPGKALGVRLREALPGRRREHEDAALGRRGGGEHQIERARQGLQAQNHARAAAVRRIVGALAPFAIVEKVVQPHARETALDRAADDGQADRRRKHLGKERYHIDGQHFRNDVRVSPIPRRLAPSIRARRRGIGETQIGRA